MPRTIRGTPTAFRATNAMVSFRRLMLTSIAAGAAAGFALFLLQWMLVVPLIQRAEVYEKQEPAATAHEHAEWEPSEGFERVTYTALGTVLTGIGYSAVFFAVASLLAIDLDVRSGLLLAVAGFACFAIAPSIGLPPRPPGVAGPDVHTAQLWWVATAALTAAGLWLAAFPGRSLIVRGWGLLVLAIPHIMGAPSAAASATVPADVVHRFALMSMGTQAVFWLVLGSLGGWIEARRRESQPLTRTVHA